jgi:hypothetical protein
VSLAARSLCVWVLAVDQYCKVVSNIKFRTNKLKEAQDRVDQTVGALQAKRQNLTNMERGFNDMHASYLASKASEESMDTQRLNLLSEMARITAVRPQTLKPQTETLKYPKP